MEKIGNLLKQSVKKEIKITRWQEDALEACKKIPDSYKNKASIFRKFKEDSHLAKLALLDCKELNKLYSLYFFKVFNELKKLSTPPP